MTLEEMLADLPHKCDVGTKKNSKGFKESWIGFKFHLDAADGQIPHKLYFDFSFYAWQSSGATIGCDDKSTNHQSVWSNGCRLWCPYYPRAQAKSLGHVAIIDITLAEYETERRTNSRSPALWTTHFERPEDRRYKERTNVERVYARLKDDVAAGWAGAGATPKYWHISCRHIGSDSRSTHAGLLANLSSWTGR